MIYEESTPKWYWAALLLGLAFLLMYPLWQLGDRELYWREGSFAAMAMEIDWERLTIKAHGELIPMSFPLFPWIAAVLYQAGLGIEIALRFISVAAMGILVVICWETGRRASGLLAGVVAAAMMLSSNIVIEKAVDGYPNMLSAVLLLTGWLVWFWFGAVGGHWNRAWMYSMFFCGLCFYTVGWSGVIYYFVPLIFMRRPLSFWPKLSRPGFYYGLAILAFFVLLWGIPRWASGEVFRSIPLGRGAFEDYWEHLLNFPFDVLVRFLPWTIFAWAPFCVALFPLDRNPIFTRFLRTIVISVFIVLWIDPSTESRDITLLAAPLAILTGMNYWIVVRRYGHLILALMPYIAWGTLLLGFFIMTFYLTPTEWWRGIINLSRGSEFHDHTRYLLIGITNGMIIIMSSLALLLIPRERVQIWAAILIFTGIGAMFFWSLPHPYRAQENAKRFLGRELREAIVNTSLSPKTVYKDASIVGLYSECYYMGYPVKVVKKITDIPLENKDAFLISTEFPLDHNRIWTNLLPEKKKYRREKLYLWHGVINEKKLSNYDNGFSSDNLSLDE